MKSAGSLRTDMPETAAFVDDMRAAFGADMVDSAIRAGMKGEGTFFASENGREVGSRAREIDGKSVNANEIARSSPCDGCKHLRINPASPDGQRILRACRLYGIAAQKCADWTK